MICFFCIQVNIVFLVVFLMWWIKLMISFSFGKIVIEV